MARPRSEDKRQIILQTAARLFAEDGLNAPTAKIAKRAGVAEGTVFTYFSSKDELLNQLYLELKSELRAALSVPIGPISLRDKLSETWRTYVFWGVEHPHKHQALAKLGLSTRISSQTRAEGNLAFCDVSALLEEAKMKGALQNQTIAFVGSLMAAMGDVTMISIGANPANAEATCQDGFTAFWNAVTRQ